MLTVAIPTYNRNQKLLEHLEHLLPQLTSECRLLIIDNASDVPVAQTLASLLARFPDVKVEIKRNRANIGANANILRCFELCETTWLWTLGDDDLPKPDAIQTIFEMLEDRPDCVFFNFATEHSWRREKTSVSTGVLDFANKIDHLGNVIWISANIYKVDALLSSLKFAHHYTYAGMPQFIMVLKSLNENEVCCFSHRVIVTLSRVEGEQGWSHLVLALGVRIVLEVPMEPPVRAALARHLLPFDVFILPTWPLVYQLLLMSLETKDQHGPLYLYDQLRQRRHCGYYADSNIRRRVKAYFYRWFLKYPHLSFKAIAFYKTKRNLATGGDELQSASDRL